MSSLRERGVFFFFFTVHIDIEIHGLNVCYKCGNAGAKLQDLEFLYNMCLNFYFILDILKFYFDFKMHFIRFIIYYILNVLLHDVSGAI